MQKHANKLSGKVYHKTTDTGQTLHVNPYAYHAERGTQKPNHQPMPQRPGFTGQNYNKHRDSTVNRQGQKQKILRKKMDTFPKGIVLPDETTDDCRSPDRSKTLRKKKIKVKRKVKREKSSQGKIANKPPPLPSIAPTISISESLKSKDTRTVISKASARSRSLKDPSSRTTILKPSTSIGTTATSFTLNVPQVAVVMPEKRRSTHSKHSKSGSMRRAVSQPTSGDFSSLTLQMPARPHMNPVPYGQKSGTQITSATLFDNRASACTSVSGSYIFSDAPSRSSRHVNSQLIQNHNNLSRKQSSVKYSTDRASCVFNEKNIRTSMRRESGPRVVRKTRSFNRVFNNSNLTPTVSFNSRKTSRDRMLSFNSRKTSRDRKSSFISPSGRTRNVHRSRSSISQMVSRRSRSICNSGMLVVREMAKSLKQDSERQTLITSEDCTPKSIPTAPKLSGLIKKSKVMVKRSKSMGCTDRYRKHYPPLGDPKEAANSRRQSRDQYFTFSNQLMLPSQALSLTAPIIRSTSQNSSKMFTGTEQLVSVPADVITQKTVSTKRSQSYSKSKSLSFKIPSKGFTRERQNSNKSTNKTRFLKKVVRSKSMKERSISTTNVEQTTTATLQSTQHSPLRRTGVSEDGTSMKMSYPPSTRNAATSFGCPGSGIDNFLSPTDRDTTCTNEFFRVSTFRTRQQSQRSNYTTCSRTKITTNNTSKWSNTYNETVKDPGESPQLTRVPSPISCHYDLKKNVKRSHSTKSQIRSEWKGFQYQRQHSIKAHVPQVHGWQIRIF